MGPVIEIPAKLWHATQQGLAIRSQARRESACVWAGKREGAVWSVHDVVYLDDLPGTESHQRYHRTPPEATERLFQILRTKGLQIVADVHTHPGSQVSLSPLDRAHPIEFRVGLVAIILPHYARTLPRLDDVGFHEYLGAGNWRRWPSAELQMRLQVQGV